MIKTPDPADEDFRDDDTINAALQTAVQSGDVELRPLESVRRGTANVQRILANEKIRSRLREAHRQKGFRPVSAALYVSDLAEWEGLTNADVIQAFELPEPDGLAALDQPTKASIEVQMRLGIDDRHWDIHLKLAVLKRMVPTLQIVAPRQSAAETGTSADEYVQWAEGQLEQALTIGGDVVRIGLERCETEMRRVRDTMRPECR